MKYLGNKTRILEFIRKMMINYRIEGERALDLFTGTGSVSQLLSRTFTEVHSVDNLLLSKILTHVKLNKTPLIEKEIILRLNNTRFDGFVTNKYSEKVGVNIFTEEIANHIDGSLRVLEEYRNNLDENQYIFLLNAIVEAADFRSNIMGSYESFYKKGWRKQALESWEVKIFNNIIQSENTFHKMSVEEFFEQNKELYDFVYCDSPYNGRQYSSVFHVPETICNNLEIETSGKVNKPKQTFKSKFSQKKSVLQSYQNLIENVSQITNNFFVSYSNEGLISIDTIKLLMERYFQNVELSELNYRKFNTNRKDKHNKVKEYILYGKK
jgi:adenine-specific DNA-methyltransferase